MIFMIYSLISWTFRTQAGFLEPELAKKLPELSRAERPLARAKSELSRAELSSDASLVNTSSKETVIKAGIFRMDF